MSYIIRKGSAITRTTYKHNSPGLNQSSKQGDEDFDYEDNKKMFLSGVKRII